MGVGAYIAIISLLAILTVVALGIFGSRAVSSSVTHECPKCRKSFLTERDLSEHVKTVHGVHHEEVVPDSSKAA